jgi:hypothetical protein
MTARNDPFRDGGDLGRSFAYAEDDFGEPLSQGAMVIDACEPEVLERSGLHGGNDPRRGGVGIERAAAHVMKQLPEFRRGHKSLKMACFR